MAFLALLVAGPLLAWAQAPAKPPASKPEVPTTIEAEKIEGVSEFEVTARGSVEFKREDLTLYSEFLRYNQEFGRVEADGGVRLTRGVDRFFGPRLRYNTRDDTGVFEGANYILHGETSTMRGKSERMEFLSKERFRLVKGSFTTCEPGKEDWSVEADDMELDNDAQRGTVRNGRLKFYDVTVLPLPYGSFSLDSQRKSGFLSPFYANDTRRGITLGAPYYWNIAPEQDLTLTPLVMSKRGAQLKTEYRYIDQAYKGEVHFDYMPNDSQLDRSRYGFTIQHQQNQILPGLSGRIDYNRVSDNRYFVDLASQVTQVSQGILQQMGSLAYGNAFAGLPYSASLMLQRWQTLQDPLAPITPPYARMPQINFYTSKVDIGGRFDFVFPAEYVRFDHPTLVEGTRMQVNPVVSAPLLAPGYYLTPKLGAHFANYSLTNFALGTPANQNVTVPWASLDGGLIFDRSTSWFGQALTQTLEPRAYYVYVPNRNQDQVPIFDTGLADFNYAQMFTENRFAGGDRFGDANQLTLAATSRLITPRGIELLRATIGQRYYFADEHVGLTPTSALRTRGQSDLLASIGGRPSTELSFDAAVQYNLQDARFERYNLTARYAPEIAKVISAGYGFNRASNIHQVDVSGQWPFATGWYAIGRVNYSFADSLPLQTIAGVEYNAGCWVFRGAFQRLQAATQTVSSGFFLQLELSGMGSSIGDDNTVTLFKRNVPGYSVTNPTESRLIPPSMRPALPFQQTY